MTAPAGRLRCSYAARDRGDPLAGTAAPTRGFVLIERPGPWGRHALLESRLDPEIAQSLARRAAAAGRRTLLIRRPGRTGAGPYRWFVADARPGREAARAGRYDADTELLDLDVTGSAGEPAGEAWPWPLLLVCTHGRHDACCGIRGRPVAAALAARRPDHVWECSHLGGDRFAANLLVLPHGFYYGYLTPTAGLEVLAAHEQGRVLPDHLRGRCGFSPPEQAAQHYARRELGVLAADALRPRGARPLEDGAVEVRLRHDAGEVVVTVRAAAAGPPGHLTCASTYPAAPPGYELLSLRSR